MRQPPPHRSGGPPDDSTQVGPQAELRRDASGSKDLVGGRYELSAVIGSGGGGVVFRGRDRVSGALVAVKTATGVDAHTAALFEREARVLALLRHAAIVKYLDHGLTSAGAPFLVMELLTGENLRQLLSRGPLDVSAACNLMARMLDALACAHGRGVVHRDLKPSNIFLPASALSQAKLLDFGVAREAHGWLRTLTGQVLGTPLYMAPEQALGTPDVDGRADIFAAGCVLVECITGRPVFAGPGSAGLAKLAVADAVVTSGLDDLPPELAALVGQMLAKDPAARPGDAAALAGQLRALAESIEPLQGTPPIATSMGGREARPIVVLMVGPASKDADDAADNERLAEIVTRWGGVAHVVISGSCLVTFGVGGARELAVRAARAALEMRLAVGARSMALALGRATVEGRVLVGAAIDETTRLVGLSPSAFAEATSSASVFVDTDVAELLNDHFDVQVRRTEAGAAYELVGERGPTSSSRLVMGKKVPFVGRDRELRSLQSLASECFEEPRCGAALVLAAAGAGKSRLRRELMARMATEHEVLLTLTGSADAFRAGAPYDVLGAAFRQAANIQSADLADLQSRKLEGFVCKTAARLPVAERARVVAFLGEMAGLQTPPHLTTLLIPARQDPRTMADQVRIAWLDWLAAAVGDAPVLLVLEDLHWGDAPSLQLVEAAMKANRSLPFVVIGFARPEVNARFPNLWRDTADRVTLAPLGPRAARTLVNAVLPDLSEARLSALIERADGNPFFLEELMRVAAAHGLAHDYAAPATVLAAIAARLDQSGDAGKRVLRAASIFGESFSAEGVEALLPADVRNDVREWLEVLANAELVVAPEVRTTTGKGAPGEERWHFRHALVQDAAYDMLTDSDRRIGHRLAAVYLQECGERDGVVLASHFERAGETYQALVQWRVAAEQSLDANDPDGVLERCARASALGPQGEELGRIRLASCRAYMYKGAWPAGADAAREALEFLSGAERREALCELTLSLFHIQNYDEGRIRQAELYSLGAVAGRSPAWAYAVLRASAGLRHLGQERELDAILVDLRPLALGSDARLSGMWYALRAALLLVKKPSQALTELEHGIRLFESVGDLREGCNLRNNRVLLLTELGRGDEAESEGIELLAQSLRIGHFIAPYVQANLACLALTRRQPEVAIDYAQSLLLSDLAQVEARVRGFGHILLAQAHLERADGKAAVASAEKATQILSQTPSLLLTAEAALSRGLLLVGRIKDARIYAESALATLRKQGEAEHAEFMIWLAAVEALRGDGQQQEARLVAVDSLASLTKRLGLLASDEERNRVLATLPEVTMLEKHGLALGVKFPQIPPTWSPSRHLKTGTDAILGES